MHTPEFENLDERFEKLALGNVHLEKLYTGCRWAEGPAYVAAGKYLLWSDFPNDRVLRDDVALRCLRQRPRRELAELKSFHGGAASFRTQERAPASTLAR